MISFRIALPWPHKCTGNHYKSLNFKQRRVFVTKAGRLYRQAVKIAVYTAPERPLFPLTQRLLVGVDYYPPDRRKRDDDNLEKVWRDALTIAGLWKDDSQARDKSHVAWHEPVKGGLIVVTISEMPNRK